MQRPDVEDTADAGMDGAVYLDMQGGTTNGDYKSIPGDVNLYNNNGQGDAVTQEPTAMGAPGQRPGGPGLPKGSSHPLIMHPLVTFPLIIRPLITYALIMHPLIMHPLITYPLILCHLIAYPLMTHSFITYAHVHILWYPIHIH